VEISRQGNINFELRDILSSVANISCNGALIACQVARLYYFGLSKRVDYFIQKVLKMYIFHTF